LDKANLIISIIIVLCIATAVAAYGIINNDNAIFSDLSSLNPSDSGNDGGNGIGNQTNNSGDSNGGTGSGSSGGSGSGSSGGSGSGSSGGSGSGSGGGTQSRVHTQSQIKAIATSHIAESGCYAGTPSYSNGYWYVRVYNSTDGSVVSGFMINDKTERVDLW